LLKAAELPKPGLNIKIVLAVQHHQQVDMIEKPDYQSEDLSRKTLPIFYLELGGWAFSLLSERKLT